MRLLHRLPKTRLVSKPTLALIIALLSAGVGIALEHSTFLGRLDDQVYDRGYDLRTSTGGTKSPVVIVVADEKSLRAMAAIPKDHWGWPWPRVYWGLAL